MRHNHARGLRGREGGRGIFFKKDKLSNLKVHELSFTTKFIFVSCYSPSWSPTQVKSNKERVNNVQERALHITYNDQLTNFKSLLLNHNEITIHQRNLQVLMTEIYEIINQIALPIMSSLFEIRENTHNTRYFQVLSNESSRTVNYGLQTICYRAPFLWANLPPEYKLTNSLNIFKRKIKTGKEKIVHVGYAKRTLENWDTFSFPRSLSVYVTFCFSFFWYK